MPVVLTCTYTHFALGFQGQKHPEDVQLSFFWWKRCLSIVDIRKIADALSLVFLGSESQVRNM